MRVSQISSRAKANQNVYNRRAVFSTILAVNISMKFSKSRALSTNDEAEGLSMRQAVGDEAILSQVDG